MPANNYIHTTGEPCSSFMLGGVKMLFLLAGLAIFGCQSSGNTHPDVTLGWEIEPDPPRVGMSTLHITLADTAGESINGAAVELEGNMSHPGMKPVMAMAEESESGRYSATIELTMAGDWFFIITSTLADDRVVKREIEIPGVRSQE